MKPPFHNVPFIVSAAAAGLLSGVMVLPYCVVWGAFLGMTLAMGAVRLNPWTREEAPGRNSDLWDVLSAALPCATLAFLLMLGWEKYVGVRHDELVIFTFRPVPAALTTLSYSVTLLAWYRARHRGVRKSWILIAVALVAGAISRAVAVGAPVAFLFTLVLGAAPFVFLWLLAARLTDPAWTKERWLRVTGRKLPEA